MSLKKILFFITIIIISILISTCDKNEITNNILSDFSFQINLKDSLGNPVENISISVLNKTSFIPGWTNNSNSTEISWIFENEFVGDLSIYDMENNLVRSMLVNFSFDFGSILWDGKDENDQQANFGGTNIFKCVVSSNSKLYDFHHICMIQNDPADYIIGQTDWNGKYYTENKLAFPFLYEIPEMIARDEDYDSLCTFTLTDTIEITLINLNTGFQTTYLETIHDDENIFNYIWNSQVYMHNKEDEQGILNNNRSVILISFTAFYHFGSLEINWATASEIENVGWNIYRGESEDAINNGEFIQVNPVLIGGTGTSDNITEYVYIDENDVVSEQTYWYWLESMDSSGIVVFYGPISITIPEDDDPGEPTPISNGIFNCPNPF